MSIMSDEVVFKPRASVFTNRNPRTGIICNFRRLDHRFTRTGDLETGVLHTAHPHVGNMEIGVCNPNAHSPWTGDVKTSKPCVMNVLSQNRHIRRKDPGAVERRAHHGNAGPQMDIFVIFAGTYFNGISRSRSRQGSSDSRDRIRTDRPALWRAHHPKAKL